MTQDRLAEIKQDQHEMKKWDRFCWSCNKETDDWVVMTPHWLGVRPAFPVAICNVCERRELDYWEEKGL